MHLHCTKGSLWIDGLFNTSIVGDKLTKRKTAHLEQGVSSFPNDRVTPYVILLRVCAKSKDLYRGSHIHEEILRRGLLQQCSNTLIAMYAQCGALTKAKELFRVVSGKDVFTWTALIGACAQNGWDHDAFEYFEQMKQEGVSPDAVTFTCILRACGNTKDLKKGEQIHDEIAKQGLLGGCMELCNALVTMYARCGALLKARQLLEELPFRDVVSWSALVAGYVQLGKGYEALDCFDQMQCEGLSANAVTLICVLKACGCIKAAERGERIDGYISKMGLLKDDMMLATALVHMYAKCGALAKARRVLEELPSRDVIVWNALITGFVEQGEVQESLKFVRQMHCEGLHPSSVTFICMLKACGALGALEEGEKIHEEIEKQGLLTNDLILGNAVVDMYTKCGALMKAYKVLYQLRLRDVITWNTLIAGYVQQGDDEEAWSCLEKMQRDGLSPDMATCSCVLSACCRSGLVEQAQLFFFQMSSKFGVKPDLEHFTCLIDAFGRVGSLETSVEMVKKITSSDNAVCSVLLGACQRSESMSVATWMFEHALLTDTMDASAFVLMARVAGVQGTVINSKAMRLENRRSAEMAGSQ